SIPPSSREGGEFQMSESGEFEMSSDTLLGLVRDPRVRMCLTTIYGCGLRLSEGTHLTTHDIDGARLVVRIRRGKGGRDRYVPLAERVLALLRAYWRATAARYPQPPGEQWLFPNRQATG